MIRNEKTGRFESAPDVTNEKQRGTVCYKSDLLNGKVFDSYEALVEAETKYEKELAEKEAAKNTRKEEAEVVKQAITARLECEAEARKAKKAAYKQYLEACDAADKKLSEAKQIESKKLNDFCAKYGSFHDTITVGDATYTCNYDTVSYVDPFKKLLDFWF